MGPEELLEDLLPDQVAKGIFFRHDPERRGCLAQQRDQTEEIPFVVSVMHPAVTCTEDEEIQAIAKRIVTRSVNHIVVVDDVGKLLGIVTSWDVTRAMAEGKTALAEIESHNVVTAKPDEPLEIASKRMAQNNISALPVIDIERKVMGIITAEDVSKLLGR